jgi:tetratricopeptide (TPR) repeat protein
MSRGKIALGVAAALTAATTLLFGGVLRGNGPEQTRAATPGFVPGSLTGGLSPGGTAQLVERLQSAVRTAPQDLKSLDLLGLAYQQRARETGDPAYYTKSDGVLHRALALQPNDLLATSGLGSLALSRHRFRDALAVGRRARTVSPTTARNYGVIGDALVELGRYREAFAAFDRMGALKPSLASYARIGHARELLGDFPGAIQAMRLALDAAAGEPEAAAWTSVQLGKIYWSTGRLAAARTLYRAALARFPGYVYAFDALAQVEAARGHLRKAIALEHRAVDTIPLPQFVSALGDMYGVAGNERQARKQYALIGVIQRLLVANGVKTDLETALFDVDHGVDLRRALALARLAHADRPSIDGDDVLAWALARNGRCAEALPWSKRSLRLGTQDALKFFHRGAIERCLGHTIAARTWFRRALALNPHFSLLWAPAARRWLS